MLSEMFELGFSPNKSNVLMSGIYILLKEYFVFGLGHSVSNYHTLSD